MFPLIICSNHLAERLKAKFAVVLVLAAQFEGELLHGSGYRNIYIYLTANSIQGDLNETQLNLPAIYVNV